MNHDVNILDSENLNESFPMVLEKLGCCWRKCCNGQGSNN